jgi:hypothetical protein
MNEISRISLADTLNVIQLARETALAKGGEDQANRLNPVVNGMQALITQSQTSSNKPNVDQGLMGQDDFKQMLDVAQSKPVSSIDSSSQNVLERNQMIQSMAAANMTDLDIARQMGISREEVNLIVSIGERAQSGKEVLL